MYSVTTSNPTVYVGPRGLPCRSFSLGRPVTRLSQQIHTKRYKSNTQTSYVTECYHRNIFSSGIQKQICTKRPGRTAFAPRNLSPEKDSVTKLKAESDKGSVSLGRTFDSVVKEDVGNEIAEKAFVSTALLALTVILCGVTNRVMYKMAIVPMQGYVFFLAQFMTFGYVLIYFSCLAVRTRLGKVTPAMLALPKTKFAIMGLMDAIGLTLGLTAASQLPGAILPILSQMFLFWQILLGRVILGKTYSIGQLTCAVITYCGVALAASSGVGTAASVVMESKLNYMILFVFALLPPALGSIVKEGMFRDAKEKLGGIPLDIFVVNSFGSGFQALFVFLQMPLLASLQGISLSQLPGYIASGWGVLSGTMPNTAGAPAPLLPAIYIAVNLLFNISILRLLRATSAVVVTLTMTVTVPLSVFAFSQPLPFLDAPLPLGPRFIIGLVTLIAGLVGYNFLANKTNIKAAAT